jgi:glutaredoxin 3
MSTKQPPIYVYTKDTCPFCDNAKQLLASKGLTYTEYRVDQDDKRWQEMLEISGRRTVPQIVIGKKSVGGFDDLFALVKTDKLKVLLEGNGQTEQQTS